MGKKHKILIAVIAVFLAAVTIICISQSGKPKYEYDSDIKEQVIKYKGKTYYPIGDSGAFEYRTKKTLFKRGLLSISSLENDDDIRFLALSEWQHHEIFTCIDNYKEKYPYGFYDENRITCIRLQNNSDNVAEYDSVSNELNDILLHPEKYSDMSKASYPLRHSAGYSCVLYAFIDDLPISSCMIGRLA